MVLCAAGADDGAGPCAGVAGGGIVCVGVPMNRMCPCEAREEEGGSRKAKENAFLNYSHIIGEPIPVASELFKSISWGLLSERASRRWQNVPPSRSAMMAAFLPG